MRKENIYRFSNQNSAVRLFLMLLERSAHSAVRSWVWFAMLSLSSALLLAQPATKPTKVFVWTFRSNIGDRPMLDNITDEFEEAVKESKKYALLERRSLGSLMLRRQEEATDMSSIGSKDQALIQTKGAEAVFFGNIFNDVDSGEVRITVTLESFDTQILLKKSQKLRPLELRESEVRQRVFREILGIPVSSARRNAAPGTAQIAGKATSNPPSQPNQQVTNSGSMQAGIVNGGLVINNGASKIDRKRISLDPALLRTYVGEYSANAYQSVTVTGPRRRCLRRHRANSFLNKPTSKSR